MFDGRGSLTISLTSRCRRRRSWCSRPFPFPGGTATTVGLARTTSCRFETEPSGGGTCFFSLLVPDSLRLRRRLRCRRDIVTDLACLPADGDILASPSAEARQFVVSRPRCSNQG